MRTKLCTARSHSVRISFQFRRALKDQIEELLYEIRAKGGKETGKTMQKEQERRKMSTKSRLASTAKGKVCPSPSPLAHNVSKKLKFGATKMNTIVVGVKINISPNDKNKHSLYKRRKRNSTRSGLRNYRKNKIILSGRKSIRKGESNICSKV